MKVKVRLFSYFIFLSGVSDGITYVESDEEIFLRQIFTRFNVKREYVGLVRINGKNAATGSNEKLVDGDFIEIYPVFGGG